MTGARIQTKQMGIVGFQKNSRAPDGHAAIVVLGGVVDESFGNRPRVMPDLASRSCVERKGIVRGSDEHDPVDHDGRDLQFVRIANVKDPLRAQLGSIVRGDLRKAGVAPARVITVVGNPVCAGWLNNQIGGAHVDGSRNRSTRFLLSGRQCGEAAAEENDAIAHVPCGDIPRLR